MKGREILPTFFAWLGCVTIRRAKGYARLDKGGVQACELAQTLHRHACTAPGATGSLEGWG
jgi:hypothetical protein